MTKTLSLTFEIIDMWGYKEYRSCNIDYTTEEELNKKLSDKVAQLKRNNKEVHEVERY